MSKLKRIISFHYPASRLPEDLRGTIDPRRRVTVTVEEEGSEGDEYETIIQDCSDLPHAPDEGIPSRVPAEEED